MVKVCQEKYNNAKYDHIFEKYSFELSDFQKYSIQAVREGHHSLVTSPTGSGKSLSAEAAIEYFVKELKKKVIYTSPIKALSNQKFHEFTKKFTDISFGIITGDIKFNPSADCLIMTTEILRNSLFNRSNQQTEFDIDIQNELGCVIFDEIHYINDRDRGAVWEESIISLPTQVQMVMLSATIDGPERFGSWIESVKPGSEVWLSYVKTRIVPLKHYSYITFNKSDVEKVRKMRNGVEMLPLVKKTSNKLLLLKETNGNVDIDTNVYNDVNKVVGYMNLNKAKPNRFYVVEQLVKHLKNNNMLPAISFILSRKQVELFAENIPLNLFLESESKICAVIEKECKKILLKLPNYEEYIRLPEYDKIVKMLKKGVAIHHSGVLSVFREMIEILFEKGFIKLIFATETFAVGINMPTKTVIFNNLTKYCDNGFRYLYSHEYTQMAGRAGRRGIDDIGHVIHLNNLFDFPTLNEYNLILNEKPEILYSKFKIKPDIILRAMSSEMTKTSSSTVDKTNLEQSKINSNNLEEIINSNNLEQIINYIKKSMILEELEKEKTNIRWKIENQENTKTKLENELTNYKQIDRSIIDEYMDLIKSLDGKNGNKRKKIYKNIQKIEEDYDNKDIKLYSETLEKINICDKTIINEGDYLTKLDTYVEDKIGELVDILIKEGFITSVDSCLLLSEKGKIASTLQETHGLALSELLINHEFDDYSSEELVSILSCFASTSLKEEERQFISKVPSNISQIIYKINENIEYYEKIEDYLRIRTENIFQFDLCDYVLEWCYAKNEVECKVVYQNIIASGMFIGEFNKALLKINNIVYELQKSCEIMDETNLKLLDKLKNIESLTLKYTVTNQSLYL